MGTVVVVPSLLRPRKVLNESGAASWTPKAAAGGARLGETHRPVVIQRGEPAQPKYERFKPTRHAGPPPYKRANGFIELLLCHPHRPEGRSIQTGLSNNVLLGVLPKHLAGGAAHRTEIPDDAIFSFACLESAARDPCAGARPRPCRSAMALADHLPARSIPAGATLHARPRPEMAAEARARRRGLVAAVAGGEYLDVELGLGAGEGLPVLLIDRRTVGRVLRPRKGLNESGAAIERLH
jgi:hypothetical protein